nr:C40 family peptidase [Treponema sp.]
MNKIKAYFVVGTIMFLLLIPFKCFSQNSITPEQAKELRETLVIEAKKYVGSPYIRGATGPNSFDCSGLVFYVARESIQFQLPRTVKAMYGFVKIIPDEERQVGDLVFFKTTGDGTISHVGIYIGNGQFISAVSDGPNTG